MHHVLLLLRSKFQLRLCANFDIDKGVLTPRHGITQSHFIRFKGRG